MAASGSIDQLIQKLENSYTRDHNSLFMIARLGPTSFQAKIGAAIGRSDLPHQHCISLVQHVRKPNVGNREK